METILFVSFWFLEYANYASAIQTQIYILVMLRDMESCGLEMCLGAHESMSRNIARFVKMLHVIMGQIGRSA